MVFEEAVAIIFELEGPLSYDTDDGLPTKWGVRAAYYPEVKQEDFDQAKAKVIYRRDYWDAVHCDKLPPEYRFSLFDCAINQGQVTAVKLLQKALRVKDDGVLGPATIQAAANAGILGVEELAVRRILRYTQAPRWATDGLGWTRRLFRVYRTSLMARKIT